MTNLSKAAEVTTLHVVGIAKSYPARGRDLTILRDVNMTMSPGQSSVVMGPSGSGKSTLLNILGALEPPTSGQVTLGGINPYSLDDRGLARFRNQSVGFIFQEHHLLPQCTVLENVLLPTLAGLATSASGDESIRQAKQLLDRVGLSARLEHRPSEISGGERQRVAIARSLINQPQLLLADEPTGNLDKSNADAIGSLLLEVHGEWKTILVVVTHSERLAERFEQRYELNDAALVAC